MTNERCLVVAASRQVLSRHARSFRWAATFLPADRHDDAAVLYAFCRVVDDAVDEAPTEAEARASVAELERQLRDPRPSHALVAQLVRMASARRVPLRAAEQLIEGVASDLDEVRVADDAELIRYCYHAAGTVGLMMCGVLGVHVQRARAHAIDLGIAMQLTNICRDVREDAAMGRVYLPASRLAAVGVEQDDLVAGHADRQAVARVVADLLTLAEHYYASADAGMRFIPARPRLAILVASRVYRAIGRRLLRRHAGDALHGRTIVPAWSKLAWVVAATLTWLVIPFGRGRFAAPHARRLHDPLGQLVGRVRG